jgi:protein-disulfide isomerase/uncharacterized membrane protein
VNTPLSHPTTPQSTLPGPSRERFAVGLVGLVISVCASAALAARHLHLFEAPGCGAESACDQVADSVLGSLPVIGWPLSHFGLAWFSALLVTWVSCFRRGAVSNLFRTAVRVGCAMSLVYVGFMVVKGTLCPYCLAVHAGNLTLFFATEGALPSGGPLLAPVARGAVAFTLVTGALVGAEDRQARNAEQELHQSTRTIIDAMGSTTEMEGEPFIGRYPRGPARAPIRIVSFVDYSCGSCRQVEEQAEQILATRDDVQLSVKHFPLCSDCNQFASSRLHPDACPAALAAETAGLVGGGDAFWDLTRWLFNRRGSFSEAQLRAWVEQSGMDVEQFFATLESDEPRRRVEADTEEGDRLGVFGTPVVYINGVELKGFHGEEGLLRAVEDLAAADLPVLDASADRPVLAMDRNIEAWRADPAATLRPGEFTWSQGPAEPTDDVVDIVLFADYLIPETAEADARVRELVARRGDVRYSFRHFPISEACNPTAKRTINAFSCPAHYAAEASGRLYGQGGYWEMHDWILDHQGEFDTVSLDVAAAELGWDVDAFSEILSDPAVARAVESDGRESARVRSFATPSILIAGRKVPNWRQPGILDALVDEALLNPPPQGTAHAGHDHAAPAGVIDHGDHTHPSPSPAPVKDFAEGLAVGPANARAKLVLWGDLRSAESVQADRVLQELLGRRSDVSYQFRHYPQDDSCNPSATSTLHPDGCLASRALEAAGQAGGVVGYWRMLDWLMRNPQDLDQDTLSEAATACGLVADHFLAWLEHRDVRSQIDEDLELATEQGVIEAPTVWLNGRPVGDWKIPGAIDRLIAELE